MKLLTDEEYNKLVEDTKLSERQRCVKIIAMHKNELCSEPECRDTIIDIIEDITNAKP